MAAPTEAATRALAREGLTALSPREGADLLLAASAQNGALAVLVGPGDGGGHKVSIETSSANTHLATIPAELGDALVARLALVAGLDPSTGFDQIGRVMLDLGDARSEVLVMLTYRPRGLAAEVRRLVGAGDRIPPGRAGARPTPTRAESDRLGPYRLLEKLGEGGSGIVYRAEHEILGKRVAVKVLRPEIARNPSLATMLLREGRLASRAESPGIVNVTDFGVTVDGRTYLAMELVDWPTLAALLRDGPVAPRRAVLIARQILAALDAAHGQGVVHRDLKPQNIFVGPADFVKIGDFGIARILEPAGPAGPTREVRVHGSPPYMAPEHAFGSAADRRSDIYAAGCILFELLTGHVPFDGDTPIAIMVKHVEEPIPAVVSPEGPVSEVLVETVRRAMAKKPEARYQTAGEMMLDLDRCLLALGRKGWQRWLPI